MEPSALSSLDVLSKACHYVATQDSLQSDGKISPTKSSENTLINYKTGNTPTSKDVHSGAPLSAKDRSRNKSSERIEETVPKKSANIKSNAQQENITRTHEQSRESNNRKLSPLNSNIKDDKKSKDERPVPPPPYTQSVERFQRASNLKYSSLNGVEATTSESIAPIKSEAIIDFTTSRGIKTSAPSLTRDKLPPYTSSPVISSSPRVSKLKVSEPQKTATPDKWPATHPFMYYQDLASANERLHRPEIGSMHDAKLLEAANAALAMRTAIPQLPENIPRFMYPGLSPLTFASREIMAGIPAGYPAIQPEHLSNPLLQAQLSTYAAAADQQQKRFYENLQALQSNSNQQYLNSLMFPALQDPKTASSAAALYQRANQGVVFPVPGYWLPQNFSYPGELNAASTGIKLPDISSGFLNQNQHRREESPRNSVEARVTPPVRQPPSLNLEEAQKLPFHPLQLQAAQQAHAEHLRLKESRENLSPKPKYRSTDDSGKPAKMDPIKPTATLASESRYPIGDIKAMIKTDAVRRYDLINNNAHKEYLENGNNKFPGSKQKLRKPNSPIKGVIGNSVKSQPVEHIKDNHLDKSRNLSPHTDSRSISRPDNANSPIYPKFPGALGLSESHIQALQAQQALLAQQLSFSQLGAVGIPPEFLSSFNHVSKLVPTSNHSPPILTSRTTAVPSQADPLRYPLLDTQANGSSENRSSSASAISTISKPTKMRHSPSKTNAETGGISERYDAYAMDPSKRFYLSPGLREKVKLERDEIKKEMQRKSLSPRYFSGNHENGLNNKLKRRSLNGEDRGGPPGYPDDYQTSPGNISFEPSSNKRKKSNPDVAAPSIEEHFRRSLGDTWVDPDIKKNVQITGSVDDHFKKSLGEMWNSYNKARPHSASPESLKKPVDYPPPFIQMADRMSIMNGKPPPYSDQNSIDIKLGSKRPVEATNSNIAKST